MGRTRRAYRPSLEEQVFQRLVEQSAEAGLPRTTYLERVVSLAHGFESRFFKPTIAPLPTAVDEQELREYVARIEPDRCTPVHPGVASRFVLFRLDEELGERISAWCDERNVEYTSYMRGILRLAAGYESQDQLRPTHVQDQLISVAGDRGRAVAS